MTVKDTRNLPMESADELSQNIVRAIRFVIKDTQENVYVKKSTSEYTVSFRNK